MRRLVLGLALAVAFGGGIGAGALASTAHSAAASGCHHNRICPNIVAPVICSNGQVYPNSCYAYNACATGCVPYAG